MVALKSQGGTQAVPEGIRFPLLPCWMAALEGKKCADFY